MADPFVIPKFREKVIYWTTTGGTEVSYPVSASYKGILRLSPNDDLTLQEKEPIKAYDDEIEDYYRDSIDPAITQQFIRISTSDGYFVGLRLSQYEIEGDDVYVIGPAKFEMVRLYTTKDNAFKVKANTALPGRVNPSSTAIIPSTEKIDDDVAGIDPHDTLDQSYLLVSRNIIERQFTYQQTTQLIRELVIESLLDLATVPTGSIYFTPISVKQYEDMIIKGRPNSYFLKDSDKPNDPIIRDYLICDGSLYKNKDFPELAKILEGERIDYWRFDTKANKMIQETYYNNYGTDKDKDESKKVFRVPDLRARFIKSLFLDRNLAEMSWNETGAYSNDARPVKSSSTTDNHVHFITTALYQESPNLEKYAQVANVDKDTDTWELSNEVGVLHPNNKNQERAPGMYGWWYPTWRYGSGCIWGKVYVNNSGYFLSTPAEYDAQKGDCTPNVGISSVDMPSCVITPTQDKQISYNDRKDFNTYVGTGALDSYGMENTPEFFCMMPLIKI